MVEFKEIKAKNLVHENIEELKESIRDIHNKNALERISGVGKKSGRNN